MYNMFSKLALSSQPAFCKYYSTCTEPCRGRTGRDMIFRMEMQATPSLGVEGGVTRRTQSPCFDKTMEKSDLQFTKLQQIDTEINQESRSFGMFVAREAELNEEYWTAAWLRAESHWEDRPNERYAESYKRKFADQEYNALKRRCRGYQGQQSTCIIAVYPPYNERLKLYIDNLVKREANNVKHTILKSVVGTLDLSIRYLLQGESFPGERVQAPLFCSIEREEASRYGYVANLCVAKSARRKGIALNMLKFAIESAKSKGAEMIFVHVHRKNTPARQLYQRLGFEIVEVASQQLVEEQMYLLSCKT